MVSLRLVPGPNVTTKIPCRQTSFQGDEVEVALRYAMGDIGAHCGMDDKEEKRVGRERVDL